MTLCLFSDKTMGTACPTCGYVLKHDYKTMPKRRCIANDAVIVKTGVRIGDAVESALSNVGITKERWLAFKDAMGLPKTCNCEERKKYLNQLGEDLGAKAKSAVASLFGINEDSGVE